MKVAFTDHLLCYISRPLGAIFWMRTLIVAFRNHLPCLISLPLGAIVWMRTVIVAFTNHLLCLVLFASSWCHILEENCDRGIY